MLFLVVSVITQTCPCNILQYFTAVKMVIFRSNFGLFSNFCPKHRFRVHVRTASMRRFLRVPTIYVLEQKYEITVYPVNPSFTILHWGVRGVHYTDMFAWCAPRSTSSFVEFYLLPLAVSIDECQKVVFQFLISCVVRHVTSTWSSHHNNQKKD